MPKAITPKAITPKTTTPKTTTPKTIPPKTMAPRTIPPRIIALRNIALRNIALKTIALAGIWVILCEKLTIVTAVTGLVIGACCLAFSYRFVPPAVTDRISAGRALLYLGYLLGSIYAGGMGAIAAIFGGAHGEITEIGTRIRNPFLRTVLVNSITLVPGSIALDMDGDRITVLWLTRKSKEQPGGAGLDAPDPGERIKGRLERMLLKAEIPASEIKDQGA